MRKYWLNWYPCGCLSGNTKTAFYATCLNHILYGFTRKVFRRGKSEFCCPLYMKLNLTDWNIC